MISLMHQDIACFGSDEIHFQKLFFTFGEQQKVVTGTDASDQLQHCIGMPVRVYCSIK